MAAWRFVIPVMVLFLFGGASCSTVSSNSYVIRKGDTLYDIARRFQVSPEEIRAENNLSSDAIRAGDTLRIPSIDASGRIADRPGEEKGAAPRADSGDQPAVAPVVRVFTGPPQIHMIRRGDTLWSLSRGYGVSVSELRSLNGLGEKATLRVATPLVIRKAIPESYTASENESLLNVARKFGMSPEELRERNNLASDVLAPGQLVMLLEREDESESIAGFIEGPHVVTENDLIEAALPQDPEEPIQARVVRVAKRMLSVRYAWGGTSLNGVDCSGFVWKVFATLDMKLPRSAREQYHVGSEVDSDKLSEGDLVFFRTYARYPSHVGIYLGDRQFIHASSWSRHVKISSLDHSYFRQRYIGAKRLFPD